MSGVVVHGDPCEHVKMNAEMLALAAAVSFDGAAGGVAFWFGYDTIQVKGTQRDTTPIKLLGENLRVQESVEEPKLIHQGAEI